MPFTLLNTAVLLSTRHRPVTNGALCVQFLFLVSLLALCFSFPVVCYLENYYFGKGGGLSHRRALDHVFGKVKTGSDIHLSSAVTDSWFSSWNAICSHSHTPVKLSPFPHLKTVRLRAHAHGRCSPYLVQHSFFLRLAIDSLSVRLQQTLGCFSSDNPLYLKEHSTVELTQGKRLWFQNDPTIANAVSVVRLYVNMSSLHLHFYLFFFKLFLFFACVLY